MSYHSGFELLDARSQPGAVRAAKTLSALVALSCGLAAAALLSLDDVHLRRVGWGWLANALISAGALTVLLLRRRWSAAQAQSVSLTLIATTLVAQVHADWFSALSSTRFSAFEGFKAVALVVATLAPLRPAL